MKSGFCAPTLILDKTGKVFIILSMLRLSTKGQYGVRAMFEIAKGYPSRPTNIREISERQEVSVAYLEQILNTLRKAGVISSVRGPGGGYLLAEEPCGINIGTILKALEGPIAITSCLNPQEGCSRVDTCVTHLLWRSLGEKIEAFLNTITLADLLEEETLLKRTLKGRGGLKGGTRPQKSGAA
jgi:Rrf2 family protein